MSGIVGRWVVWARWGWCIESGRAISETEKLLTVSSGRTEHRVRKDDVVTSFDTKEVAESRIAVAEQVRKRAEEGIRQMRGTLSEAERMQRESVRLALLGEIT